VRAVEIVPLLSSRAVGPLGATHLARLWLKVLLSALGRLPEGYRSGVGGFDETTFENLGIDCEAFIAFVREKHPDYLACEAWVRKHATKIDPASIAAHNEYILERCKSEESAATQREYIGIDAPELRNAVVLNDLDDWATLHRQLLPEKAPA